jgi:hypothetical protein
MTSADRNDDLSPAQEKLEWVTPKISLMGAEDTDGGKSIEMESELEFVDHIGVLILGPS